MTEVDANTIRTDEDDSCDIWVEYGFCKDAEYFDVRNSVRSIKIVNFCGSLRSLDTSHFIISFEVRH
jgi:hypothetical protein